MDLPSNLINSVIKDKAVFYLRTNKISSDEPHYFIVISNINNKIIALSCCTTQYDTILKYIKRNKYPDNTIADIDYNNYAFLKTSTFINCNSKIEFDYDDFVKKHLKDEKGEINDEDYKKIVDGMLISPDIEEEFKVILKLKKL
jgi:hypothetical protein